MVRGRRLSPPPPLAGVRVADLTDGAGAFCAQLLRDLGADVAACRSPDASLDVALIAGTPRQLAARDLAPAQLVARQPHLIVAALSPFGLDGPRAEWRSSDLVAQALGGMLLVNGPADGAPLRAMGPQAMHSAGLQAALGVVLALLARRASGRGQVVDVAMQESVTATLEHVMGLFRADGHVARRQGTLHWSGTFRLAMCRDGPALLSHMGDWTALIEWVKADGAAADLDDPRWADPAVRRAECAHLFDVLDRWAATYRVDDLIEQAQHRRLPFAPVWPLQKLAQHPQLWARGFFVREDGVARIRSGGPFRFETEGLPADEERAEVRRCGGAEVEEHVSTSARQHVSTSTRQHVAPPRLRTSAPPHAVSVLSGVRILDLTWVVAGPVATRVLADHGADVIKIERVDAPDGDDRRDGIFGHLNRGKRSLAVDLGDARGLALLRELARRCDVVIDNFSPRVMANWGLDAASLHALNPRLIVVGLSGFGASGPWAGAVSYGPTLQAQSGFTWHMRHPGGEPAGWGYSFSDMVGGYCAALAVLAALWQRGADGPGYAIDLAQLEILAACVGPLLDAALNGRPIADALGNRGDGAACEGVYRCRDAADGGERWCAVTAPEESDWRRLAAAIGAGADVADAAARDAAVGEWMRHRDAAAAMQALQAAGLAAGIAADARDLAADEQLAARGYWVAPPGGPVLDGIAARLSATPGRVAAPAPRLGEHADELLRGLLGMEQSAIDRLRAARVIR